MALEDRIRPSVDEKVAELTSRLEAEVRELVERCLAAASEERDEVLAAARQAALDEAAEDTKRQVEEAEARLRATIDEAVAQARDEERARAAAEAQQLVEAQVAERLASAASSAEATLQAALSDASARAAAELEAGIVDARAREREGEMAALARLLESVRGLDGATTLSEVLDALALATAREAARAAVFVVRQDRLVGWKLSGFGGLDTQPKAIDLDLAESGVLGAAVRTARPMTTRDASVTPAGPVFAELPPDRVGMAVPVIVGGRVVAVAYADGAGEPAQPAHVPSGWPEVVELLTRHAARCLEALTAQKAAAASSPRFWAPGAARTSSAEAITPDRPPAQPPQAAAPPGPST